MAVQCVTELNVYQQAYELAMQVFQMTRSFPSEERYALTSQIRRSSRSICLNLREAWAKRRYPAHFVSKLTDCDGEANETDTALRFAHDCGYINEADFKALATSCDSVRRMFGSMINRPDPFLIKS